VRILAADVGATRARFATFLAQGGKLERVRKRVWPSAQYDGIRPLLEANIADEDRAPDRACLALAGPVEDGFARLPNLGWLVDRAEAAEIVSIPSLRLVNDFVAVGHGILELQDNDTTVLQEVMSGPVRPLPYSELERGSV